MIHIRRNNMIFKFTADIPNENFAIGNKAIMKYSEYISPKDGIIMDKNNQFYDLFRE